MSKSKSVAEVVHDERMAMSLEDRRVLALESIADTLPKLVMGITGLSAKLATASNVIDKKLPS